MSGDRPRSRLFARPSAQLVPTTPGPLPPAKPPAFDAAGEPTLIRARAPEAAPEPPPEPAPDAPAEPPQVHSGRAATLVPFDEGEDSTLLDIPPSMLAGGERGDAGVGELEAEPNEPPRDAIAPAEAPAEEAEVEPAELEGEPLAESDDPDGPGLPGPWDRPVARVRRAYTPGMLTPAPLPPGKVRALSSAAPKATVPAAPHPVEAVSEPAAPAPSLPELAMASAPGKIILIGEHAVVYGHRAIAAAVDLCTTVTLRRRPGPSRIEDGGDEDPRLAIALGTLLPAEGVAVSIRSTLPVGCGMGSSAALAVATVRALARLEGREASLKECIDRGFVLERVFHGNPSGLDHTVSASGGALVYRRGEPAEELVVGRALRLVIANTGVPADTAEMVARVRQRNPTELLMRVGALVEMTATRIASGEPIGEFLREAHRMMRLMGVSTPRLDELCRAMEGAGSTGAKLAGAGGGGIVIALVDERTEDAVRKAAGPLAPGGVFVTDIAATHRR
ncbi:hypothetical protein LBMAG42_13890 [Deltaproteobacteria bacterium]|nr:hypothetical protein LBMAG42_13890 [Deltaproteobacteria bacterium]